MNRPQGYSLVGYGDMVTDRPRMDAYVVALRQAIRPGCVVLDIGAGTGIFSLLACQFGAARVHAVEPNDAIRVAQTVARENGYADRITFHQAISTDITLPEPADVMISDLRGVLPLLQHHVPTILDARRRLLAPGGQLIPRRDTIWAALVEAADAYRPFEQPWTVNAYGLDMRAARPLVVNTWRRVGLKPDQLLVEPRRWAELDYRTIESPHFDATLTWVAERPGTAHGVLLWFDAELGDGIRFSNAPGEPEMIYGQAFFPFEQPAALSEGDRVAVRLAAGEYVWRWGTEVCSPAETPAVPSTPRLSFRQSTFFGGTLGLEVLHRHEASHVPRLSDQGEVDRQLLSLIDGQSSLGEIARRAAERFPERYPRWQEALTRVAELAKEFGG